MPMGKPLAAARCHPSPRRTSSEDTESTGWVIPLIHSLLIHSLFKNFPGSTELFNSIVPSLSSPRSMTHLHYSHPQRSLLYPRVCTTFHWSWAEQTEEEACLSMFSVPFLENRQHKYSSVRFMTTSRDTDRNRVGCCKPYTSVINTKGRILPSAMQRQLPFTSTAFLHAYLGINLRIWPCLWKLAMYLPVKDLLAAHSLLEQKHLTSKKKKCIFIYFIYMAHLGVQVCIDPFISPSETTFSHHICTSKEGPAFNL